MSENQGMQGAMIRMNHDARRGREAGESDHVSALQKADTSQLGLAKYSLFRCVYAGVWRGEIMGVF